MSQRLEDFVNSNRDAFDSEAPSEQAWSRVQERLNPVVHGRPAAKVVGMGWIKWAAAAAIILATGTFLYVKNDSRVTSNQPPIATVHAETPGISSTDSAMLNDINPAYAKEVYHFTQLIELKQSELKQIEKDNPELYKQFLGDINKLDSSYLALKQQLPANPNREQLLEAMISNLQLQMDLLNQQLQIIQQIRKGGKESAIKNQG